MRTKPKTREKIVSALRLLPVAVCIVLLITGLVNRDRITVEGLLNYPPENKLLAAAVLVAMYALKSLAIFFPLLVLNIVGGMIFPPAAALVINIIGVAVMTALPYGIGRFSGAEYLEKLEKKYPKIAQHIERQRSNEFFLSFFLRIISCLPGDIVSLYFGAARIPFGKYFVGSMLGIIPGVITATFMGTSIFDPTSKTFIISVLLTVLMSVLSIVIHWASKRKGKVRESKSRSGK